METTNFVVVFVLVVKSKALKNTTKILLWEIVAMEVQSAAFQVYL